MHPLSRPPSSSLRLVGVALAGTLTFGSLAACSAGGDSSASGSADLSSQSQTEVGSAQPDAATAPGAAKLADGRAVVAPADSPAVAPAVADRKLARHADISLRVTDVAAAATRLRAVASAAGGLVVAEQVSSDPEAPTDLPKDLTSPSPAPGYGTVTISVPTDKLDATLDAVAKVGTVLSRQTATDDVTAKYVDTTSRVASMKASVERVRALMSRADKLGDIVTLEAELSRRQADLEAMQQQLASLDDQVTLAPIAISLSTTATPVPAQDPTGFLAGLASGWEAFTTSVRLVLTLVGALLPFAAAAALVLVPLGYWWRRRRGAGVSPAAPPAAPAA